MFRFMFLCAAFLFSSPVVGAAGATNVTVDVTELYLLPHTHAGTSKRVYGTLSDQKLGGGCKVARAEIPYPAPCLSADQSRIVSAGPSLPLFYFLTFPFLLPRLIQMWDGFRR